MSKARRVFKEPLPDRNFQALGPSIYAKRGFGAFFTFAIGDFCAQVWARYRRMLIVDSKSDFHSPSAQGHAVKRNLRAEWDLGQVLRSSLFGALFFAPLRLRWHESLDRLWPLNDMQMPSERRAALTRRFAAEHAMFLPCLVAFYFMFHSVLELRPLSEAPQRGAAGIWQSASWSWLMWMPVQGLCWFVLPAYTWNAVTAAVTIPWVAMMANFNRQMRHRVSDQP